MKRNLIPALVLFCVLEAIVLVTADRFALSGFLAAPVTILGHNIRYGIFGGGILNDAVPMWREALEEYGVVSLWAIVIHVPLFLLVYSGVSRMPRYGPRTSSSNA